MTTEALLAATHPTPAGPFTLLVLPTGAVSAGGFTDSVDRVAECLGPRHAAAPRRVVPDAGDASKAVAAWADGDLDAVLDVDVELEGTVWQRTVWAALRAIPAGTPLSYAALAASVDAPSSTRAAARGCATNRVSLFVPCHRVVRTDGTLGGFLWGLPVKAALLRHESRQPELA